MKDGVAGIVGELVFLALFGQTTLSEPKSNVLEGMTGIQDGLSPMVGKVAVVDRTAVIAFVFLLNVSLLTEIAVGPKVTTGNNEWTIGTQVGLVQFREVFHQMVGTEIDIVVMIGIELIVGRVKELRQTLFLFATGRGTEFPLGTIHIDGTDTRGTILRILRAELGLILVLPLTIQHHVVDTGQDCSGSGG